MSAEELINLGNGYDLASELKSTYYQFISYILNKNVTNFQEQEDLIQKLLSNETAVYKTVSKEDIKLNIWYMIFIYSKINQDSSWCDVERQIYNIVIKNNNQFLPRLFQKLYGKSQLENSKQVLLEELNKLESDFEDFILNHNHMDNNILYFRQANSLLEKIVGSNDKKFNIMTFNYTSPWWDRWKVGALANIKFISPEKFIMVHGESLERWGGNHIIFGIDSQNISPMGEEYQFTKTFRTLTMYSDKSKPTDVVNQNVFDESIKVIKFFGHSLGEADYSYFQQMFDFYNLYENNEIKLYFYYRRYGNKTNQEMLQEQVILVSRLIEKYGETLDNKNHGKNLLTRLQQTQRIFIQEI